MIGEQTVKLWLLEGRLHEVEEGEMPSPIHQLEDDEE